MELLDPHQSDNRLVNYKNKLSAHIRKVSRRVTEPWSEKEEPYANLHYCICRG